MGTQQQQQTVQEQQAPAPSVAPQGQVSDPQNAYGNAFLQEQLRANGPVAAGPAAKPAPPATPTGPAARPPVTAPTVIDGPFGKKNVVPDSYTGDMTGKVRDSEYREMEGIMDRVQTGQSQLTVDTSDFTRGLTPGTAEHTAAEKKAKAFRSEQMQHLNELVQTPTGLQMMRDLDASKHTTTIRHGQTNGAKERDPNAWQQRQGPDGTWHDGPGTGTDVTMNPDLKTWPDRHAKPGAKVEDWRTERPKYGLYHELVHAWHNQNGSGDDHSAAIHGNPHEVETVGQGKLNGGKTKAGLYPDRPVSENAIRREMKKDEREIYD